jgi:hypothetical protein
VHIEFIDEVGSVRRLTPPQYLEVLAPRILQRCVEQGEAGERRHNGASYSPGSPLSKKHFSGLPTEALDHQTCRKLRRGVDAHFLHLRASPKLTVHSDRSTTFIPRILASRLNAGGEVRPIARLAWPNSDIDTGSALLNQYDES